MNGSVFKRCTKCGGTMKQRRCAKCGADSFKWAYIVDVGRAADGRRLQRKRGGFTTRKEADRALRELLTSVEGGTYVNSSTTTLGQYLRDEWLPATAPPRTKWETWNDRRENLETYVIPRIGGVELQQLNAAHLNRLYAELLQSGRVRTAGGLSPTSVRRIHGMLRKALKDAIRWGLAERNAAELADPPSTKVIQAARRRSMRTWSEEDLRRFLAHTPEHELGPMWLFAASTGVRRSELLGVRWSDIDLKGATVTIRQTVLNSEDGHRPEEDQKTVASARTIHLDRRTVATLRAHRAAQAKTRLAAGAAWEDNDLVFTRLNGDWWNPDSISSAFRRAVGVAGVPVIRLHDVRHSHASLLLKAGVNAKVVSERLGHSSVALTLDTYAHVLPGMQPEAAEMFMRLVLGQLDDDDAARAAEEDE